MKLSAPVAKETMDYIVNGIRYCCDTFKERDPGSESERNCQAYFKKELEQWSDEVDMEDFDVHPYSFFGWIPIAGVCGIIAVVLYVISIWGGMQSIALPIIAAVLTLFGTSMLVFQFLLYRKYVDFLFPKRVSRNVMARRKPTGEVKRRIIFGGHSDAVWEWRYSYIGGIKTLAPVMASGIGGLIFTTIVDVIWVIKALMGSPLAGTFWTVIGIIELVLIPGFVLVLFFINWDMIVDGANDNLSACYPAMTVLKEMADNDFRYENTEVCCLIAGSEEAGLRGSLAYSARHKEDLSDVETIFIAMDTMREIEEMQVYTRGQTGTVHDSEAVGELIREAGLNCGIDMPRAELYPGAIDSEGFTRNGLTAAGFCGVNHNPKPYYHTREDTADNINPDCIKLSLEICKECAELYDQAGGLGKYEEMAKKL